jgi:hypothetical protein
MSNQRIKGQETELIYILNGEPKANITNIRSFEAAIQTEILKEGYLNEKTDRRDEIFRGCRGKTELHFENGEIFKLIKEIVDRAQRQKPGSMINFKATMNFPSGERIRHIFKNVFFGEIPIGFPSRADYGTINLEWECEGYSKF